MSGMQKTYLIENNKYSSMSIEELEKALSEVSKNEPANKESSEHKRFERNISDITNELERKKTNILRDKAITGTLTGSTVGKSMSTDMATFKTLQAGTANLEALTKKLTEREKEARKKLEDAGYTIWSSEKVERKNKELQDLEAERLKLVKQINDPDDKKDKEELKTEVHDIKLKFATLKNQVTAQNEYAYILNDNEKQMSDATAKAEYEKNRISGKNRNERYISSTERLKLSNPLIVPIKTDTVGSGQLNFSQMLAVAGQNIYGADEGEEEEARNFESTIDSINKALIRMMPHFKQRMLKSALMKDSTVTKLLDLMSVGNIENNADLVKLCWLYLGGEDTLKRAKNNSNFITVLTKLEGKKESHFTHPIELIEKLEDIPASDNIKKTMDNLKKHITDTKVYVNTFESDISYNVIGAPDSLYSGFSPSTNENIADTFYYAFIDAFGSPEDKALLLKRTGTLGKKGLEGSVKGFLTPEAKKTLALKQKALKAAVEDGKVLPSSGRVTSWGAKNVNSTYERYLGGKLSAALGGGKVFGTEFTDVQQEVDSALGKALDFTRPVIAENKGTELKTLFLTKGSSVSLSEIKAILEIRFESVKEEVKAKAELAKKRVNSAIHFEKFETVYQVISEKFREIIDALTAFTSEDAENLISLFKASLEKGGEIEERSTKISLSDEKGQTVLSWVKELLPAVEKYRNQSIGTLSKDETELGLEKRISRIKNSLGEVKKETNVIHNASLDNDVTPQEEEDLPRIKAEIKQLTAQYDEAIKDLENYKKELKKMGIKSLSSAGDKQKAAYTEKEINKIITDSQTDIDLAVVHSLAIQMPSDILIYVDPLLTNAANNIMDTLLVNIEKNGPSDASN